MTPGERYRQLIASDGIVEDASQAAAVELFDALFNELNTGDCRTTGEKPGNLFSRLLTRRKTVQPETITKGIYIWGAVGRGKTWLMDIFFNELPFEEKRRYHFHQFMREVHEKLAELKGRSEPIDMIADGIARKARVVCLDEFIVSDIGDAMILHQFLKGLFNRGVVLVTSSNTEPDRLYEFGLQRSSFVPAIELLKEHTHVLELDSARDYRLRTLERADTYYTPLTDQTDELLAIEFEQIAPETVRQGGTIPVFSREIPVKRVAHDVVWFDFMALCGPPRSQADYLELSKCFHTVFISDIPVLGPSLDDATRRFVYLVDCFYDRNVKLIVSAARPARSLYQGERLAFDFQRTISRLREMQSKEYLGKAHRVDINGD